MSSRPPNDDRANSPPERDETSMSSDASTGESVGRISRRTRSQLQVDLFDSTPAEQETTGSVIKTPAKPGSIVQSPYVNVDSGAGAADGSSPRKKGRKSILRRADKDEQSRMALSSDVDAPYDTTLAESTTGIDALEAVNPCVLDAVYDQAQADSIRQGQDDEVEDENEPAQKGDSDEKSTTSTLKNAASERPDVTAASPSPANNGDPSGAMEKDANNENLVELTKKPGSLRDSTSAASSIEPSVSRFGFVNALERESSDEIDLKSVQGQNEQAPIDNNRRVFDQGLGSKDEREHKPAVSARVVGVQGTSSDPEPDDAIERQPEASKGRNGSASSIVDLTIDPDEDSDCLPVFVVRQGMISKGVSATTLLYDHFDCNADEDIELQSVASTRGNGSGSCNGDLAEDLVDDGDRKPAAVLRHDVACNRMRNTPDPDFDSDREDGINCNPAASKRRNGTASSDDDTDNESDDDGDRKPAAKGTRTLPRKPAAKGTSNLPNADIASDADDDSGFKSLEGNRNPDSFAKVQSTGGNEEKEVADDQVPQKRLRKRKFVETVGAGGQSISAWGPSEFPSDGPYAIHVGTRVYAEWPENGEWYFGTVTRLYRYLTAVCNVDFDDGDVGRRIVPQNVISEREYLDSLEQQKRKSKDDASSHPTLETGSRCLAQWTNSNWYPGKVVSVKGSGLQAVYKIEFDDGYELNGLGFHEVRGEDRLRIRGSHSLHEVSYSVLDILDLQELRSRRCRVCVLCTKPDCGRCRSCVSNIQGKTRYKEVCLLKMCCEFDIEKKAQVVSDGPLDGWRFVCCTKLPDSVRKKAPLHPELVDIAVLSPSGRFFRGAEAVPALARFPKREQHKIVVDFYRDEFGVDVTTENPDHVLVGKIFARRWIDAQNQSQVVYGKVTKCKCYKSNVMFMFEYDELSRQLTNRAGSVYGNAVPEVELVAERVAWGSCIMAQEMGLVGSDDVQHPNKNCLKWIVPEYARNEPDHQPYQKKTLVVKGFALDLIAKKSGIPNAGLGLWISCRCLVGRPRSVFELKPAEMVDLGVYAPLRIEDRKSDAISLSKAFLHSWMPEGFNFDSAPHERSGRCQVLDLTDDYTGGLHAEALRQVLPYVNETDGRSEKSSILAEHDPSGAVHYLLGNLENGFTMKANGKESELKIDYGAGYEKVRVRRDYPRVKGAELEVYRKHIAADDAEMAGDVHAMSSTDLIELADFLVKFREGVKMPCPDPLRERILLLALYARSRILQIENYNLDSNEDASMCDEGYDELLQSNSGGKMKDVIAYFAGSWGKDYKGFKRAMTSQDFYKAGLATVLKVSVGQLDRLQPVDFRRKILNV